jgi:tetratricopeptide (TPR) repeat protein
MGRHTESISHAKQIVELDPLSGYFNAHLGLMFTYALRLEEAINHLKQTLTTFPNSYLGHWFLGIAYRSASKMDEAIKEYYIAKELSNGVPIVIAFLANALYETGNQEEAESLIKKLEKRSGKEYVPAMCFFGYYLLQSDHDRVYKYLEQAIREHDGYLFHYLVNPIIEYRIPVNESRCADLLKKAGFERFINKEE